MKRRLRHCVYCGDRTFFQTCRDHRDLLKLDPHYWDAKVGAIYSWRAERDARRG